MDLIRDVIEWLSSGWGDRLGLVFPLILAGLIGLYLLWLLVGYLRVSQVGIGETRAGGRHVEHAVQLPRSPEGTLAAPRGVPYCPTDGIQFPAGARYCTVCERDLSLDCANCGATLRAADASCYRCGVRTGAADNLLT